MKQYYFHDGQIQQGPYSLEELKQKHLSKETPIWFETLEKWTPAGQIEELDSLFVSPPPFPISTPPSFQQNQIDNPYLDESSYNRKRKRTLYFLIGSVAVLGFVIFLFIQNSNSTQENQTLANQLATAQTQIQTQTEENAKEEKEKQERLAAATARNMEYRNNWYKYVSVDVANFNALSLGGFDNISLKTTNNVEFPIDLILVEITYWKSNGDIYKTEQVSITDIPARDFIYSNAPSSSRGTRLTIDIIKITARKFNFCYDSNSIPGTDGVFGDSRNPKDPWKCGQ